MKKIYKQNKINIDFSYTQVNYKVTTVIYTNILDFTYPECYPAHESLWEARLKI